MTRIAIIQGHPDATARHFGHALAEAYSQGAQNGGHEIRQIVIGALDFPLLRSKADWDHGTCPPALSAAQESIRWADHLLIIYPLWLGSMPALLKGFFEQVFRPGFAIDPTGAAAGWSKRLHGKSARVVVTMGMPSLVYRWFFLSHSLKSFRRNILLFVGIRPVSTAVVGMVEGPAPRRAKWIERMRKWGEQGC